MVAGAMHGLGVFMGDDLPVNIEDPNFNADGKDANDFLEHMKSTIEQRNNALDVWGWKFPRATMYIDQLHRFIRNPHYVVVYRDPIPGAIRQTQGVSEKDHLEANVRAVRARLRSQLVNTQRIEKFQVPTLLVSYEKASTYPRKFLSEMSQFLGQPLPSDLSQLLEFLTPGEYKPPIKLK